MVVVKRITIIHFSTVLVRKLSGIWGNFDENCFTKFGLQVDMIAYVSIYDNVWLFIVPLVF